MNIHYKIVEVWPSDHLIVARYWTDEITEEFLASDSNRKDDGTPVRCRTDVSISLPIPEPSSEKIYEIIQKSVPLAFLESLEKIKDPNINTSMNNSLLMANIQNSITLDKLPKIFNNGGSLSLEKPFDELTEEEIQKLIG